MFESLTEKFQGVFKTLRGQGTLTEENAQEAFRQIRLALLEADVNLKVVKQLMDRIQEKALGQEVRESFSPAQAVIQIVYQELQEVLGGSMARLKFASQPPSVYLMAGLQGSGKTTTSAKLARWLQKGGHHPLLVSVDVYRPAAREQLAVAAKAVGVPVYAGAEGQNPMELAKAARQEARQKGLDVLIVDSAGRLHIDEELMVELAELRQALDPIEVLLVADAMTGQDAVRSAEEFHSRLGLTGVVLTKLDGDARGGAALSIRLVTGQPIKFVGVGEKYDQLEQFHPDRMASRILGMGDVISLIEKAQAVVDRDTAEDLGRKLRENTFTLEDFREQIRQARKMGPLQQLAEMLPSFGGMKSIPKDAIDDRELVRVEAIINSMTHRERNNPQILNGSRRKRIARGSGSSVQAVNQLLKQYDQARKMMRSMVGRMGKRLGKGMASRMGFPLPG
ncbi:MAG: signal recognition particle protein [Acidobacteria bacterium]|nr:signal recognition particle protein [Acidobacteriota bacterium]